jgi:hypothetical protein
MEIAVIVLILLVAYSSWVSPDKTSTSYKLGRGTGSKLRKFGEWWTRE